MTNADEPLTTGSGDPQEEPTGRPPAGLVETLLANSRPQPAIPALLVLFLTVIIAVFNHDPLAAPDAERSLWTLLIPLGIVSSCALAIAAGFCSFFPQVSWSLVALWATRFAVPAGPLPIYNRYVLWAGLVAAALMLVVQVWRVVTGRFVPTIRDAADEEG